MKRMQADWGINPVIETKEDWWAYFKFNQLDLFHDFGECCDMYSKQSIYGHGTMSCSKWEELKGFARSRDIRVCDYLMFLQATVNANPDLYYRALAELHRLLKHRWILYKDN